MRKHVIEISTEVFHLLRKRAPRLIAWSEEKPGLTQKILLEDDVYSELIDRAIAHRQTLDQVVQEACTRKPGTDYAMAGGDRVKGAKKSN